MYPEVQLFIDGAWCGAASGRTLPVLNPATNEQIGTLPHAGIEDLDRALAAAEKGFQAWRKVSAFERSKVIRRAAGLLRERVDQIAPIMTTEQGKPLAEARIETLGAADTMEWFAEEARRTYGRVVPARAENVYQLVVKEPVGPVAAFSPWNFPINQAVRKISASLAAGCSIIIKGPEDTPASLCALLQVYQDAGVPAGVVNLVFGTAALAAGCSIIVKAPEETPASPAELVRALVDAGLPPGALQLVFGMPSEISEYLIPHPVIRKVSFTGSTPVGKQLAALAGQHMKRVTMELGGHAPAIVFEDADLDAAAKVLAMAKFRNAGQVCVAPTRFLVQESVFDGFVDRLLAAAKAVKVGDGLADGTTMGPLAHERRLEAMDGFMSDARQKGAEVRTGGERIGNKGNFFAPTVVTNVNREMRLMNEEPFGPIALMMPFRNIDDAVEEANRLPYGLASYAYTRSTRTAAALANQVEAGMLTINHNGLALPEVPFGGIKDSGYGSEGGAEAIENYLNAKLVTQA
jgi:succinate-semialdehyde dehydrogenase / glutarate-semialdehyde dehydrogenase